VPLGPVRRDRRRKHQRGGPFVSRRIPALSLTSRVPALAPFGVRSFRFQWPADLATSWAFEMETLILGWYVLVETGSVFWLAAFGSLQFLGTLVAPMFGVLGDRIGHRNLLCIMRAIYGLLAATLMMFIFAGVLTPVHVFAIGILSGIVRPSDLVMRNAIVGETMPAEQLMRAMGVSRTTADSARVAGALAGAGLVATLGMGPAYVGVCAFYAVSFLLTLGVANSRTSPRVVTARAPSPWRDLREGLGYVITTPHLLAAMVLAFQVNLTAFPLMYGLLPYVAREVYQVDQTGLGWLVASFSFGALMGSIALSTHGANIRPARIMLQAAVAWYVVILLYAHVTSASVGMVLLALAGFAQSLCLVPLAVMLLRSADPRLRGRVMGVRMLAVYGLPLGLLGAGPLIERFGFAATGTAYALIGITFTLWLALHWRSHLWPREAPANA
jgi:predicted MFS family arabinose efflux permease